MRLKWVIDIAIPTNIYEREAANEFSHLPPMSVNAAIQIYVAAEIVHRHLPVRFGQA